MPTLPNSGATGFAVWNGPTSIHFPIYGWAHSLQNNRQEYRTAISKGGPVGTNGTVDSAFTIKGAGYNIPELFEDIISQQPAFTTIGWYDFKVNKKRLFPILLMLTNEFRVDFNYSQTPQPGFTWQASFTHQYDWEALEEENLSPMFTGIQYDHPQCFIKPCTLHITTSDYSYFPSGIIQHVRNASIVQTFERPRYRTSLGLCNAKAVTDIRASLVIDGDFNYWIDQCGLFNSKFEYHLLYGSGPAEYFTLQETKVDSVDNLNVNVQTGELISATVNLSIANG